jgi:hypothetical protein
VLAHQAPREFIATHAAVPSIREFSGESQGHDRVEVWSPSQWQPQHRSAQAARGATRYQQWRSGFYRDMT